MNKKGFTLIELLAAIAILAIIMIIAVPKIIDSIDQSKKKSFFSSAKAIIREIDYNSIDNLSVAETPLSDLNINGISSDDYDLSLSTAYLVNDTIYLNLVGTGKFEGLYMCEVTEESSENATQESPCIVYKESILNGAYPRIGDGMIPVTIADNGTVTTVDPTSSTWYSYTNKQWANVVLVKETGTRSRGYYRSNYGVTVNEADILAYLVWIPRYRYTLWNEKGIASTYTGGCSITTYYSQSTCEANAGVWTAPTCLGTCPRPIEITFESATTAKSTGTIKKTNLAPTSSISSCATNISGQNFDFNCWAGVVFSNSWVINNLKPSTKYYMKYDIKMVDIPNTYTSMYSLLKGLNLYSGVAGYSTVTMENNNNLMNENQTNLVDVTFTTPANLLDAGANYTIRGYTERYLNDTTPLYSSMRISDFGIYEYDSTDHQLTHPAFTFDGKELNGIWVGKFETTQGTTLNVGTTNPTIKPNITSWKAQNVSTEFNTSLLFGTNSTYGLNGESRMSKNSDWGVITYLSHSQYGINGEIRINNNSNHKTGCGATVANSATTSTCEITYGAASSYPQSTTGNISGIFDMSGGAYEYQMGAYTNATYDKYSGMCDYYQSGYKGIYGDPSGNANCNSSITSNSNGLDYPESKYYKIYSSTGWTNNANNLGDALGEVRGWYKDSTSFAYASAPWFIRGGHNSYGVVAGDFAFNSSYGFASNSVSFRTIITTR